MTERRLTSSRTWCELWGLLSGLVDRWNYQFSCVKIVVKVLPRATGHLSPITTDFYSPSSLLLSRMEGKISVKHPTKSSWHAYSINSRLALGSTESWWVYFVLLHLRWTHWALIEARQWRCLLIPSNQSERRPTGVRCHFTLNLIYKFYFLISISDNWTWLTGSNKFIYYEPWCPRLNLTHFCNKTSPSLRYSR